MECKNFANRAEFSSRKKPDGFFVPSIPLAPVFRPTEEEFADPIKYIHSIYPMVMKYGACKVVPPRKDWLGSKHCKLEKVIDFNTFRFKTKLQSVHQLQHRSKGPNEIFVEELVRFLAKRDNRTVDEIELPQVDGRDLDLFKVYNLVVARGGFAEVCQRNLWKDVIEDLRVSESNKTLSNRLQQIYAKFLLDYENTHHHELKKSTTQPQQPLNSNSDPQGVEGGNGDKPFGYVHDFKTFTMSAFAQMAHNFKRSWFKIRSKPTRKSLNGSDWIHTDWDYVRASRTRDIMGKEECNIRTATSCCGYKKRSVYELYAGSANLQKKLGRKGGMKRVRGISYHDVTCFDSLDYISPDDVEAEYWRIIEEAEEKVDVHYGSDLDVQVLGSGFPIPNEYSKGSNLRRKGTVASGWNLNVLPLLPGSPLSYITEKITGVNSPMMYVGMLFSTFCWHLEDNYLYSINYVHSGDQKTWYVVPGASHTHFEEVFRKYHEDLFLNEPDLLYKLVTMLPPRVLKENNVPVYKIEQSAGEFVITLPKVYHAGFNCGFNCAEAVNFALEDWLEDGFEAVEQYRCSESLHTPATIINASATSTPPKKHPAHNQMNSPSNPCCPKTQAKTGNSTKSGQMMLTLDNEWWSSESADNDPENAIYDLNNTEYITKWQGAKVTSTGALPGKCSGGIHSTHAPRASALSHHELLFSIASDKNITSEFAKSMVRQMRVVVEEEKLLRQMCSTKMSSSLTIQPINKANKKLKQNNSVIQCAVCKFDCYLSVACCTYPKCSHASKYFCLRHIDHMNCLCKRGRTMYYRYETAELDSFLDKVTTKAAVT